VKGIAIAAVLGAAAAATAFAVTRPDPATQARLDGCKRSVASQLRQEAPEWVFVGDRDAPASGPPPAPQWAKGTLPATNPTFFAVHPTRADSPRSHDSYDVLLNILPDAPHAALLGGDPAARTGNFEGDDEETGRLHSELEQRAFPTFAWPEQGDRVEILGNWIWDCGHWAPDGEHTEFHPFRALWVARRASPRSPYGESEGDLLITTSQTSAGKQEVCAHRTKGDGAAFKACLASEADWQDVNGSYRFTLAAPPRPSPGARLRVRVVDAGSTPGAPAVSARLGAGGTTVSVTISEPLGKRVVVAKKIFVGWSPIPAAWLPEHLRLTFRRLLVRRAMDPGCPNARPGCGSVETTLDEQISSSPGEWAVYSDVAGIWSAWAPPVLRVGDGQVVGLSRTVDFYVARRAAWRLFAFARECDFGTLSADDPNRPLVPCPPSGEFGDSAGDDSPGSVVDRYRTPAASLGLHASDATREASTCPAANVHGCYRLTYAVALIDDAAARARARR
jgi:hypothetical protein